MEARRRRAYSRNMNNEPKMEQLYCINHINYKTQIFKFFLMNEPFENLFKLLDDLFRALDGFCECFRTREKLFSRTYVVFGVRAMNPTVVPSTRR